MPFPHWSANGVVLIIVMYVITVQMIIQFSHLYCPLLITQKENVKKTPASILSPTVSKHCM